MRMRRKKHLEERIGKVSDYIIIADKKACNVNEAISDKKYLNYKEIFNNDNEVVLEIGCGKGGFSSAFAEKNPDKNVIAVELLENIIVLACEKAKEKGLKNVKFMNTGAEYLPRYLKDHTVSTVFLNFSPPYPPKSNENRRLTNDRFCKMYKNLLINGGQVKLKTDDKNFFDYSFNKMIENGFSVLDITEKLNSDKENEDNIVTEYEAKFRAMNMPIFGFIATLLKNENHG